MAKGQKKFSELKQILYIYILQIVLVLKKEVASTSNGGGEGREQKDVTGYRQSLVQTLHQCSVRFASVAPAVVPLVGVASLSSFYLLLLSCLSLSLSLQLLDFLSDSDEGTAEDVLAFVREAIQQYPRLKGNVVGRLLDVFGVIKSVK